MTQRLEPAIVAETIDRIIDNWRVECDLVVRSTADIPTRFRRIGTAQECMEWLVQQEDRHSLYIESASGIRYTAREAYLLAAIDSLVTERRRQECQ